MEAGAKAEESLSKEVEIAAEVGPEGKEIDATKQEAKEEKEEEEEKREEEERPEILEIKEKMDFTEIRDSPLHGRGLFATKCVREGQVVMGPVLATFATEVIPKLEELSDLNATCALWLEGKKLLGTHPLSKESPLHNFYPRSEDITPEMIEAVKGTLFGRPGVVEGLFLKYAGSVRNKNLMTLYRHLQADASKATAFAILYLKMKKNAFVADEGKTAAWFEKATFANHSCKPNVEMVTCEGPCLIFIALRDIREGEEIAFSYTHWRLQRPYHRELLSCVYGVTCDCGEYPTDCCWDCGKLIPQGFSGTCSKCHRARYCSKECQKRNWNDAHRAQCNMVAALSHLTDSSRSPSPDDPPVAPSPPS